MGKNPSCPLCNEEPKIRELVDYHEVCGRESASPSVESFGNGWGNVDGSDSRIDLPEDD